MRLYWLANVLRTALIALPEDPHLHLPQNSFIWAPTARDKCVPPQRSLGGWPGERAPFPPGLLHAYGSRSGVREWEGCASL